MDGSDDPAAGPAGRPRLGGPGARRALRRRDRLGNALRGTRGPDRGGLRRARHDPTREAAWIAELDGRRVGCVFCTRADEETAQLRVMLVHPDARGRGLGARLTAECVRFARDAGYRRMRLWTTTRQVAARAPSTSRRGSCWSARSRPGFGETVTGQTYELDLTRIPTGRRSDHPGAIDADRGRIAAG